VGGGREGSAGAAGGSRPEGRHFERDEGSTGGGAPAGVRLRAVQGRGPGDRVESPYDTEARFRAKREVTWVGYMAHFTETCDKGAPHLVVHTDTTPANVHEAMRTEPIHAALADKGLAPAEHLVDAAYVSAGHLVSARERYGIDLVGPPRRDVSWQRQREDAFGVSDFVVDWERRRVRCPEGKESTHWGEYVAKGRGPCVKVGFRRSDCAACPSQPRCTRTQGHGRRLTLHPRPEHEALALARAREQSEEGRQLYAQRQGIEGTFSQGVRAFGLRRARYRGLAKTGLQSVATAAALNLDRLGAWLTKRPLAPTRISRFAALAA
jgi:Transposase DDE domain